MEVRVVLKGLLGITMIACFLYQMGDLFNQYLDEKKTVAVSFEEHYEVEFPSFAFCDSKAFSEKIRFTSNISLYNASTFYVDVNISTFLNNMANTCTIQYFPTLFNGYCKLFEFSGKHAFSSGPCR